MNFIKRAVLSVKARKGKSLLQIFIFTMICVLVLSGLAIQSAANKSADMARESLGGQVTLQVDFQKMMDGLRVEGEQGRGMGRIQRQPISLASAEELITFPQIIGYNFYSSTTALASDFEPVNSTGSGGNEDLGAMAEGPGGRQGFGSFGAIGDVSLEGVVFSDSVPDFMNAVSTIVEGRHLTEQDLDQNVTIIEKIIAETNEVNVGDTITIQSINEENTFELEVVGIFLTTAIGNDFGLSIAALSPYNKMYIPYTLANELKGEESAGTIDSAIYHLNDPANIDQFIAQAQEESSIDFSIFTLDANDRLYQQMIGPISNVASFSQNVVYLVTVAGAIILGLIVMMSIRERKYEMGVLLALGEKKSKLIGQFVVEILIVAVIAIGISSAFGHVVANQMGEQLINQQLKIQETSLAPDSFMGFNRNVSRSGMPGGGALQQVDPIDELSVQITVEDLGMLAMIGIVIAILSTIAPSLSILRLHPKTILSKQD